MKLVHQRLLRAIEKVAGEGARCPTNEALGEVIGADPATVGHALKEMRVAGLIAIQRTPAPRRITIAATGACTAGAGE